MLKKPVILGIILLFLLSSILPLVTSVSSINADFLDIDNLIHESYGKEEEGSNIALRF